MSDKINHECGIAFLRLRKPLSYFTEKYGSPFYGINKMYLLMEKQHNRGQDGAGFVSVKINPTPGEKYIYRRRAIGAKPLQDIFTRITKKINNKLEKKPNYKNDPVWVKKNIPYVGDVYLGHLRYGTYGKNSIEACHPFIRSNNWISRNLIMAGNFNMTNVDDLFDRLINIGQHPKAKADTVTVLERAGHFLDEEVNKLYANYKSEGINKKDATPLISENLDIKNILENTARKLDGGYTIAGIVGHGDAFIMRDPNGIRPAYYYADDEIIVATSERPVIQTSFKANYSDIKEIPPGCALIIKKNGDFEIQRIKEEAERLACSFERIYFSRGNDADIYQERLELGRRVTPKILNEINYDLDNSVFSFIPNTAEVAFYGMLKALEDFQKEIQIKELKEKGVKISDEDLRKILEKRVRLEKIAIKDAKLRTFITDDNSRDDLVSHVYDVTYGVVKPTDNLIVIDDSVVRGTTLQKSIIKILDTLNPKRIIVVSSAPQIRYPDCYGIDMAKLQDFIAFRAAIELLKETNQLHIIEETYKLCKNQEGLSDSKVKNYVRNIYDKFTADEISVKIAQMIKEKNVRAEVSIIFQSIEDLHESCKQNLGDWYFTGKYPTVGGNRVVNKAFINYYEGKNERAY